MTCLTIPSSPWPPKRSPRARTARARPGGRSRWRIWGRRPPRAWLSRAKRRRCSPRPNFFPTRTPRSPRKPPLRHRKDSPARRSRRPRLLKKQPKRDPAGKREQATRRQAPPRRPRRPLREKKSQRARSPSGRSSPQGASCAKKTKNPRFGGFLLNQAFATIKQEFALDSFSLVLFVRLRGQRQPRAFAGRSRGGQFRAQTGHRPQGFGHFFVKGFLAFLFVERRGDVKRGVLGVLLGHVRLLWEPDGSSMAMD